MKNEGKNLLDNLNLKSHWNSAYESKNTDKLGWYESYPKQSLQLIEQCNLDKNASLLNVGVGATTLIDELLKLDYKNIIASDISATSLEKLKNRLGLDQEKVQWIVDDLIQSEKLINLPHVDLWHDRAVLHFFTTKKDQDAYFNLLFKLVKIGGYVIIATFNLEGALKCCGLPVYRYDKNMLEKKMGKGFKLIDDFDFTFNNPSGDTREYVYTLFMRIKKSVQILR